MIIILNAYCDEKQIQEEEETQLVDVIRAGS